MLARDALAALDTADPFVSLRDAFVLPDGVIYLDGNSLGPLPRATAGRIAAVVEQEWGQGLIRSWNDAGWIDLASRVAAKIAVLIGAEPDTVAVGDSTSVNTFKALAAALALRPGRHTILSQQDNFPTDLYVADGLARLLGGEHRLHAVPGDGIAEAIDPQTAVVLLTHVNYRTGALHDLEAITNAAHARGALVIWDLAHSAGAMPLDLAGSNADFAVGCGYKFLNGGPGAPGFLYAAPRHHGGLSFPLTGWLGHAAPFAFEALYRPAPGIARAVVGTPPILSLAALDCGLDTIAPGALPGLRAKSLRQSELLVELVAQFCPSAGFVLATPAERSRRGSQVSLHHEHAYEIMQALIEHGVIGDFRVPDILRFGITPMTLRYADLWDAATILARIMDSGVWREAKYAVRRTVT